MCGICGIAHKIKDHPVPPSLIDSMCQTIIHRGPDDQGVFVENQWYRVPAGPEYSKSAIDFVVN